MGMTIAEKIIARAAGVESVRPGDIHTVEVDRLMSNDGTTHLTIDMYNTKLKHPHIADVSKLVWIVDHNVPSDSPKTAASQKKMRDFAKEHGITFYEGQGVCHQIMMENHVCPGELIFGADSHTCAYGALGAFGTGVGCTDYLYAMVTGKSWVLVPETLRFNLTGKLPEGVYARDLILTIIGKIGANGANYKAMEFAGEGLKTLTMSDRIAIINQGVLEQIDTPINIYQHPKTKFVAGFIGSPQMNFIDAKCTIQGDKATLTFGDYSVVLPDYKAKKLEEGGYNGKTVVLGIRPEDISDDPEMIQKNGDCVIESDVTGYELLGAEVLLYYSVAGANMTARVDSDTPARYGDHIKLAFDPHKIHVFDKETELTITN